MKKATNHRMALGIIACAVFFVASCAHKSGHRPRENGEYPVTTYTNKTGERENSQTKIHMRRENGVYLVPITVNGLNLDFIFDTGASSICLSSAEALVMLRQGKISQEDILGQQQFMDATGGISVGTTIRLRSVEIGGIELRDVEATVVDNIQAPLLLGQTALAKFGRVTIDYDHNTIEFN